MSGRSRRDRSVDDCVVRIRGLPYEATAIDLCNFFRECRIRGGPRGIYFCVNDRKLPTGVAYIELESMRDVNTALRKHRERLGQRYLEVFEARQSELDREIRNGATNEFGFNENRRDRGRLDMDMSRGGGGMRGGGLGFGRGGGSIGGFRDRSPRGFGRDRSRSPRSRAGPPRSWASEYCIKLRGLPWSATKEDVLNWLEDVEVCGNENGVVFIMDPKNHRPSGDAYVEVQNNSDIKKALKLHKKDMGSRYIEVFEANTKDVARAKDNEENDRTRSDAFMVNLRGLPYSTTEREVADWLSEAADPLDVIITSDRQGRPSGQANAYFKTEEEARRVVSEMHRRDLGTRYIECYMDGERGDRGGVRERSRSPVRGRRSSRRGSESD